MFYITLCILCGIFVYTAGQNYPYKLDDYYNWWGPEETRAENDTSIIPSKIKFDDQMIENLKRKLNDIEHLTPPLKDAGYLYGVNSIYIRNLSKYWAEEYPFEERETYLNKYPHFKTRIQGLLIHFIRYRTNPQRRNTKVLPLMLLHGWPGSIVEFYIAIREIEKLCEYQDYDFDIIIPCLPGFGFSEGAIIQGMGVNEVSVILYNLMVRIGHDCFFIQGGGWGGLTASVMAVLYPHKIMGLHTNSPVAFTLSNLATYLYGIFNQDSVVDSYYAERMYPVIDMIQYYLRETGYLHVQSSKPDTIGHALETSPSGALGWLTQLIASEVPDNIYREDSGIEDNLSRETIIDNMMFYWPKSLVTSTRYYSESFNVKSISTGLQAAPILVPSWTVQMRNELFFMTEAMLRDRFVNLLQAEVFDYGTHFFAWEIPDVYARSLINAINGFRTWKNIELYCEKADLLNFYD